MFNMTVSQVNAPQTTSYRLGILAVCVCYLIFQMVYVPYGMLSRDELWFAHHIYHYIYALPYRDFPPYKTVLGYYLLSIPMYFSHSILAPLYYIKDEIAILNAIAFGGIALWASRWFQLRAIFYTLLIILSSQFFLIYSTDLRVDMLASWLCLISILCCLSQRFKCAGVLLALGFLVSQKVLWYCVATDGALGICYLLATERREIRRAFFQFNFAMLATLLVYVGIWSCFSSLAVVLHSVFYEAYTQSAISFYASAKGVYWQAILQAGPLLILLWPLTVLSLFDARLPGNQQLKRVFIVVYASVALMMMTLYQQLFPYNIVFFVPACFVLYAEFFSWLILLFKTETSHPAVSLNARQLFWFFSLYVAGLISVMGIFHLSPVYFTMIIVPLVLWVVLAQPLQWRTVPRFILPAGMVGALLLTGVFNPLIRTSVYAYQLDGQYQKDMIRLTQALLQDQGEYVAGIPLLYNQDQTIAGLKNLIAPAIQYLHAPDPGLLPVLLPALDMTPRTVDQVLQDLQARPIKLMVDNDRIERLPPRLMRYFSTEFEHYWGGIYLYSPTILPHQHTYRLKFTAQYKVEAALMHPVMIDGKTILPGTTITLASGEHRSQSDLTYRLRLQPGTLAVHPDPATYHNCLSCFAKPVVF